MCGTENDPFVLLYITRVFHVTTSLLFCVIYNVLNPMYVNTNLDFLVYTQQFKNSVSLFRSRSFAHT